MSITFDQVDGVVQKDADSAAPADGAPAAATQRPVAEQHQETQARLEWMTRRIAAD